jgi:hypothetical protein
MQLADTYDMRHFLVVVEAVLVGVLGGAAFFRGRRWWGYRLLVPVVLALVICELAPVVLHVTNPVGEIAIAGLLMAQGTLLWAMLRKEQADRAELVQRIRLMLQDRVRNKLQVIAGATHGRADVFRALEEIAQSIDELDDGALVKWENGYAAPLKHQRMARAVADSA